MIRIGICEDDATQAERIKSITEKTLFKRTEYMITTYMSGEELLESIDKSEFPVDLLLLDINMNKINGLETAQYIRKHALDVDIIFVTVSGEHVYEGYLYKAFSFMLKKDMDKRLESELDRYLDERERADVCMEVSINGTRKKLPINKIYYFESNARKVVAHMGAEDVEFYQKLEQLEELLSQAGFVRIHQSYLINEQYINSVAREMVDINGIKLPVSRKYYELLRSRGKLFN